MEEPRKELLMQVDGMTCSGCANAVERTVHRLDPSAEVEVDLAHGRVRVVTCAPCVSSDGSSCTMGGGGGASSSGTLPGGRARAVLWANASNAVAQSRTARRVFMAFDSAGSVALGSRPPAAAATPAPAPR